MERRRAAPPRRRALARAPDRREVGGSAAAAGPPPRRIFGAIAVGAALLRGASAETSQPCRTAMVSMINDDNWKLMNYSANRWCRLRLENAMANCCEDADFVTGRGEGCTAGAECTEDCRHRHFDDYCNNNFGKACVVTRYPFFYTGAEALEVQESFCVPSACDNEVDRAALLGYFNSEFVDLRVGWHLDYNRGTLECPGNVTTVVIVVIVAFFACWCPCTLAYLLFKRPRERGKTLISQADMQRANLQTDEGMGNTWGFASNNQQNALRDAAGGVTEHEAPPMMTNG